MMVALLSLAAAGICFGLCYALIQAKIKPQQELSQRLRSIDSHEEDGKTRTPSPRATQRGKDGRKTPNFHQRVIIPFQENLGRWITNLAPATWSKELEHKTTAVDEVEDVYSAKEIIAADIEHYIEKFCKG